MAISITMPALSPTMEHGRLARWLVSEGDAVAPGDVIAEIETDKATMEVEAVDEGVLARLVVPEGTDNVKVGSLIAVLKEEGDDDAAVEALIAAAGDGSAGAGNKAAEGKGEDAVEEAAEKAPPATAQSAPVTAPPAAQSARAPAAASPASSAPPAPSAGGGGKGRVFATPLARRMAGQAGIDLAAISGSGPRGRIVKADVERAIGGGVATTASAAPATPTAAMAAATTTAAAPLPAEGEYELVAVDSMRRVIAERLTLSKQTVPHFYLSVDCAIDRLLAARKRINASAPKGPDGAPAWKISVNDFIIKAWAMALMRVPRANAVWTDEGIRLYKRADVAVAVAIDGGLITPVIRGAEGKSLSAISAEMKELAARARERKLAPEEYTGGATSISNLGMYGVQQFAAVINPPQSTILAVGKGEPRPVVEGGEVKVRTMMTVTLSVDHRAVDGALGAQLLSAFRQLVEEPALMLA